MLDQPNLIDRRSLLKRTGATASALLTAPTVATANEATYRFESQLSQEAEGPLAIHYQLYFPEATEIEYTLQFTLSTPEGQPYGALKVYHGQHSGYFGFIPAKIDDAAYVCDPFLDNCDGDVVRDEFGAGLRRSFTLSVEADTLLDWTVVAPDWSYPEVFSDTDFQLPYRLELECDAPFSASVEAGSSVYAFDQHSFEDGAAAATCMGYNSPIPNDRTTEADVRVDQELTASIPEEKARVGLITNGFVFPGGADFGMTSPQNTRVTIDYPNGNETWTLLDHYYVKTLLGDGGFYRLGLNRAHLANDPTFAGFIAGFEEVDDIRDAI